MKPNTSASEPLPSRSNSSDDQNMSHDLDLQVNRGANDDVDDDDDGLDDGNHHSLPSPEELKVDLGRTRGGSKNQNRSDEPLCHPLVGIFLMLLISALIIGLSLGLTADNRKNDFSQTSKPLTAEELRLRRERLTRYIVKHGVSQAAEFELILSPQSRALDFVAVSDQLNLDVPSDAVENALGAGRMTAQGYKFITRYVMAVLYFATGGPTKWGSNNGFLALNKDTCEWLVLDDKYGYGGVRCDTNNVITGIRFVNNGLDGTLPQELGYLTTLKAITIVANKIEGSFPPSFHRLTNLQVFAFHKNFLTGNIPSWLGGTGGDRSSLSPTNSGGASPGGGSSGANNGGMDQLTFIDVSGNMLTGILPPFDGAGLKNNLEVLAVDDNSLEGNIDVVWDFPNLKHVNLEKNSFSGELPNAIVVTNPKLVTLDVSENRLGGSLPGDLFQLTDLEILDLHGNDLTGTLPSSDDVNKLWSLSRTLNFKFVALHDNSLSGSIPTTLGPNLGAGGTLRHLDLSRNQFVGEIPAELKDLALSKDLSYLSLGDNDYTPGPIPTFLYTFSRLRELSLKSCSRTGPVSPLIAFSTNLILLDLSGNAITGPIPTELGEISNLQFLLLHRNSFTGQVPSNALGKLSALQLILLDRNDISGSMQALCDSSSTLKVASSDCLAEIACDCCDLCCADEEDCHDLDLADSVDWNTNYERDFFNFGAENFEAINSNP